MEDSINDNEIKIADKLLSIITNYQNGQIDRTNMNMNLLMNLFALFKSTPNFLKLGKYRQFYLPISKVSYEVENNIFYENNNFEKDNALLESKIPSAPQVEFSDDSILNSSTNNSLSRYCHNDVFFNEHQITFYEKPIQNVSETPKESLLEEDMQKLLTDFDKEENIIPNEEKNTSKLSLQFKNSYSSFYSTIDDTKNNVSMTTIPREPSTKTEDKTPFYIMQKTLDYYYKAIGSDYINCMLEHFHNLQTVSFDMIDNQINKVSFIKAFKVLLLYFGVSSKHIYQEILRVLVFVRKEITFDDFIQSFKPIFSLQLSDTVILFKFLLFINNLDKKKLYYNEKQIKMYFNMIQSSLIKEKEIANDIIEQLVVRYEKIYCNEENNNIKKGLYNIKKLGTILETFFSHYMV